LLPVGLLVGELSCMVSLLVALSLLNHAISDDHAGDGVK
jgi:hypothetical protein